MILCITGPMAAGKNAVSAILEKKGFATVDADMLAHVAIENLKPAILNRFSADADAQNIHLLKKDGSLDRRALGILLFKNPVLLAEQEKLVHPEVCRLLNDFISANKKRDIALNATVLYKTEIMRRCDAVIFVNAPCIIRFIRARKRDHMKILQILARFRSQRKLFAKYKTVNADIYNVRNTGNLHSLEKKLDAILIQCR